MAAVVALIAKATFPYNGRALTPGDLFEAVSERDAETLRLLDKAEDAPLAYSSKDLTAETTPVKVDRRTRAYRRRDLVPEP